MSTVVTQIPISRTSAGSYLFGPVWDFLLLGGGSLFALLALRVSFGSDREWALLVTLSFASIVNNPHFANSYQIFYRDFRKKLTSYPVELRWRYLVSGIVVPLGLTAFFTTAILTESTRVLGIGANLMFFLVGWHYVKQGYGMAMVDAVLKKAFYKDEEKKLLLANCYTTWIFSWWLINYLLSNSQKQYFGISYFAIPMPLPLLSLAGIACAYSTLRVAGMFWKRMSEGQPVAWNGVIAYGVSLYAWLLIRDPIILLWIPFFHSLQYTAVVWRFEINRGRSVVGHMRPALRFGLFAALGIAFGYFGFWVVPQWLDANIPYSREFFGASLFMYVFWIFINVHHYFLDTVMWRRGNPDVSKYLFSANN